MHRTVAYGRLNWADFETVDQDRRYPEGVKPDEFDRVGCPWGVVLEVIVQPVLEMARVRKSLTAQTRTVRCFLGHQAYLYRTPRLKRHCHKTARRPEWLFHVKRLTTRIISQTNKPQTPTPNRPVRPYECLGELREFQGSITAPSVRSG
jgi:hypothetical protein